IGAIDPRSPVAHRDRGMCLRDLGRYDEARESIDQARQLGVRVNNELATLALESGDARGLETQLEEMRVHLGANHWYYHTHAAALAYMKGDFESPRRLLDDAERSANYMLSFTKWTFAICANDLDKAIVHYSNALQQNEHLAYTWSQGSVGMKKLFPWYYESSERVSMLRKFGLDADSVARLRVTSLR